MGYVQDLTPLPNNDATGGRIQIDIPDLSTETGWKSYYYLPGDVIPAANYAALPATGAENKLYITLDDYSMFIWDDGDYQSVGDDAKTFPLEVNLSALDTNLTAVAGVAKFPCPENMTIISCFINVTTAPTGSAAQWDINVEGVSILTNKIIIEAGEYSSLDATTQPSFSDVTIDKGEDFVIDRDAVGATVAGQNDVLTIIYQKR